MIDLARQTIRFRELLGTFIGRELRGRYRGSMLGSAWIVIQPILYLVVYFVVFVKVLQIKSLDMEPAEEGFRSEHWIYPRFLKDQAQVLSLSMFVGLIPWISFSETVMRASGSIFENANLIKKFNFPCQLLPVYLVAVSLVNTAIAFAILTVAMFLILGGLPHFVYLLPVLLILQACFTLGFAYLVASLTVFVRDIAQTLPMIMTFWFFLSPIFYVTKGIRDDAGGYLWVVQLNPMRYLIEAYREMFVIYPGLLSGKPSDVPWDYIGIFALVAFATLGFGYAVFMRLKPRFADEI